METLPLKLSSGSDLRLSLEKVGIQSSKSGFVIGVVGNLSKACFQCPGRSKPTVLEGNLEIITLNGTVTKNGVHLHLSISDSDCNVWGGHLEPGSVVLKAVDLLVGFIDTSKTDSGNTANNLIKGSTPRLEIAVMPGCPWCTRALRMIRALNIPHIVKTIEDDNSFLSIKEQTGIDTFPQVFIDGIYVGGYEKFAELHASKELEELR